MPSSPTAAPGLPGLIVLAAGASSRLGRPKALVDLGGRTALARLLDAGCAGMADAVAPPAGAPRGTLTCPLPLVVSGADHVAIEVHLRPLVLRGAVELLENRGWAGGRTSSVQIAVRARPGRDLIIAPVDAPLVPARVFAALVETWLSAGSPAAGWLAPCTATGAVPHAGALQHAAAGPRPGHPVLIGRDLLARLLEFPAGAPLRALRALAGKKWLIEVRSARIHDDLDGPEDWERLQRIAASDPA